MDDLRRGRRLERPGVAIACRLSIGRYREDKFVSDFEKADLMVTATFGQGKNRMTFQALGPEDTNEMDFVLPLVPLAEGESVAVSLVDRNVLFNDALARFTITRRGAAPLTIRAPGARGECRSVPRAVIEASFEKARASEVRTTKYECGPGLVKTYGKLLMLRRQREGLAAGGCVVHLEVRSRTAGPVVLRDDMFDSIGPLDALGLISKTGFWFRLDLFAEVKKGAVVRLPSKGRRGLHGGRQEPVDWSTAPPAEQVATAVAVGRRSR